MQIKAMKKIAYLILAHSDATHLNALVKSLSTYADIYIHLDIKANLSEFVSACPKTVTFIEDRVNVAWAGISMVDALLNLIKAVLPFSENYTHFVFITGSDYPIKPEKQIFEIFVSEPERQFIKYIDMRESPEHYLKLITHKQFLEPFTNSKNKILNLADKSVRKALRKLGIPNKWSNKVIPYFGHTWCALTPQCCEYILDYHNDNPWFYESNKQTFSPDEHYFHTIIGNSPFNSKADGLQAYEGRGLWRLVNTHLICPSLQKWYTLDDWEQIISSDKLFVRKVNSISGGSLVEEIDAQILINSPVASKDINK